MGKFCFSCGTKVYQGERYVLPTTCRCAREEGDGGYCGPCWDKMVKTTPTVPDMAVTVKIGEKEFILEIPQTEFLIRVGEEWVPVPIESYVCLVTHNPEAACPRCHVQFDPADGLEEA